MTLAAILVQHRGGVDPAAPEMPRHAGAPETLAGSDVPAAVAAPARGHVCAHESVDSIRAHLLALAADEALPRTLVFALGDADVAACNDMSDDILRAFLRMLHRSATMDGGTVPEGYTQAVVCASCGPVWLWTESPAHVLACPWCFRRKAGVSFPQPP